MIVAALTTTPLVDAAWVLANRTSVRVVDTRRASEYLDGHVPGAVSFQLGTLQVEDTSRAALLQLATAAQHALGARGIGPDDYVVLTDDGDGSACVGAFICELAGMRHVSVIDGGVRAWLRAGGTLEAAPASHDPVEFTAPVSLEHVAPFEDLVRASALGVRLVDTRSGLEHEGIVGPPCCPSRGHIPGSLNLEWSTLLAATGDMLRPERVRSEAHHLGLSEHDDIIVYCHSGQRSAVAGMALRSAGFTKVRNSFGSWHEWSHRGLMGSLEQ